MVIKNIIYCGTSEFAISPLKALLENNFNILLVITQEDQPKGRGMKLQAPPIKEFSIQNKLNFIQPNNLKESNFLEMIKNLKPELIIVAAYGKILPSELLNMPKYGCINIHGSLLPKYRGAAPIQAAILNGDKTTGISIIKMNEKMDEGDIILQQEIELIGKETTPLLSSKLSNLGAILLLKTIELISENKAIYIPQNHSKASYARKIKKEDGRINWNFPADYIERMIRAYQPWPSAYCNYKGKFLKIFEADYEKNVNDKSYFPSQVINIQKDNFTVLCGSNTALIIKKVQFESSKIMDVRNFLNGHKLNLGDSLA